MAGYKIFDIEDKSFPLELYVSYNKRVLYAVKNLEENEELFIGLHHTTYKNFQSLRCSLHDATRKHFKISVTKCWYDQKIGAYVKRLEQK